MNMKPVLTRSTLDHVNAIYAWHATCTVYWNVLYCLDCNLSAALSYWEHCKAALLKAFQEMMAHLALIKK